MSFHFGILSSINPTIATLAFICTIIFLLFFEFLTGALEYILEGNHVYNQMLQKIYKELMVMGFVSFVLAMYRAQNDVSNLDDLFRVTEFVEYILFFLALFYVAHCLYIMFISVVTSNYYEKVHAHPVLNILEAFTKLEKSLSKPFLSVLSYLPISRTIQETEFKIIYALFRDTYWLPLNFDYGAYLSGCLATYTHKLINVGVHSWIILIGLSLLNLARLKLFGNSAFNCHGFQYTEDLKHHSHYDDHHDDHHDDHGTDDHATDDHHRFLSTSTTTERHMTKHCLRQHLNLFFICGALLCLYAILLYSIAQVYMKRLLGRAGVLTVSDYSEFLMFEERAVLNVEKKRIEIHNRVESDGGNAPSTTRRHRRMSIRTFKSNIETLRAASGHDHNHNEEFEIYRKISRALSVHFHPGEYLTEVWDWLVTAISSAYHSLFTPKVHDIGANRAKLIFRESTARAKEVEVKSSDVVDEDIESGARDGHTSSDNLAGRRKRRVSTMFLLSGGPLAHHNTAGQPGEMKSQDSMTSVERFKLHKFQQTTDANEKIEFLKHVRRHTTYAPTRDQMKLTEDMSQIYLFNSPELFCRAIEVAIMLNSLYLSLWATNFIFVVNENFANEGFIPVVFVLPCIGEIVKTSSLLSAIAELNLDVIGSVLEDSEDRSNLVLELQEKINIRLEGVIADQKEVLSALFDEIDTDGSGLINRSEFRNMLQALHLHYSDQKFKRLYKAVDRNKDGSISIDELYSILYPEKAEEEDILKRSERVERHIEERRQSQAIHNANAKSKSGAFNLLRGLSKALDIETINEDIESKKVDKEDEFEIHPSPKTPTFSVGGGKVVRLSKAATTGRISVPQQGIQPFTKFEPKKPQTEDANPNVAKTSERKQFTELPSPRQVKSPTVEKDNVNPYEPLEDGVNPYEPVEDCVNPYQGVEDGYDAHSDMDEVTILSPTSGPRASIRNRSKSEEAPPKPNNADSRNSIITSKHIVPLESDDVVSGFDETSQTPSGVLPPIKVTKNWNVADIEE